jgi:hypothetical protein
MSILMQMLARQLPDEFMVAFSFAGEQRELVRAVVEVVEQELGAPNVFFDEWFEHYIAGGDADLKLQQIYVERCVLAVICISERYGGKPWTSAEYSAIRARYMMAQGSQHERDRLGILPIRVGDGEVDGILFNTIVPDIRQRTPPETAKLIIDRLHLILPNLREDFPAGPKWPEHALPARWPMADHVDARLAFENLLTSKSSFRFLPVQGPSEVGKTRVTMQMFGNALHVPGLACGRFDFKGTTDMDSEVRSFVQQLGVPVPSNNLRLNQRFGEILDALRRRSWPALLIFDTYEAAGEARDWVEKQLLPGLIRTSCLRVVIAGQRVPEPAGAVWDAVSSSVISLQAPQADDWFGFSQQHKPAITLDFVRQAHHFCNGKPSVLAELLGPKR